MVARRCQLDCPVLARFIDETISDLGLDHRPVLPNEHLGNANIRRLHVDAARSSSDLVFHLEMKCIAAGCIYLLVDRPVLAAHFGVPVLRQPEHLTWTIWPLARRVHGAARSGSAPYCGPSDRNVAQRGRTRDTTSSLAMSVFVRITDSSRTSRRVRKVPIVLQKSKIEPR